MDFPGCDKKMRKILGTSMFIGSESRRPSFGNLDAVPVIAITDIEQYDFRNDSGSGELLVNAPHGVLIECAFDFDMVIARFQGVFGNIMQIFIKIKDTVLLKHRELLDIEPLVGMVCPCIALFKPTGLGCRSA